MKFVIVKSESGFADRFQLLCFAIHYSKHTGRTIVVDWTDEVWCGQETQKDFFHYLSVQNYEHITSSKKFKSWYIDYIKEGNTLSVFPKNFNILLRSYGKSDKIQIPHTKNNKFIDICANNEKDYSEDIVVIFGNDKRSNSCLVHCRLIGFNDNVFSFIKNDPFYTNIIEKNIPYCAVHLRGGDRMSFKPDNDLFNNSSNVEVYVNDIYKRIPDKFENILVLTDTQILLDEFLKIINNSDKKVNVYQTGNIKITSTEDFRLTTGLHLTSDNKYLKNLELLKDFYFIIKSDIVVWDNISYFSDVGRRVNLIFKAKDLEDLLKI
jgi:hypothetical protein